MFTYGCPTVTRGKFCRIDPLFNYLTSPVPNAGLSSASAIYPMWDHFYGLQDQVRVMAIFGSVPDCSVKIWGGPLLHLGT
jgi:hypothetical protein